jgi:hypothetical protein
MSSQRSQQTTDREPNVTAAEALLRLQLAEYDALMSRGNYFMSFYVGITGVVVAIAVFVVPEWLRSRDFALLWLGAAAVQAVLHLYATYVEEHYLLVSYVENNLREAIVANVPTLPAESFWQGERCISRRRIHENWWGEWVFPGSVLMIFAFALGSRRSALWHDKWWILLNAALLLALLIRAHLRRRLRKRFARRNVYT